MNCGQNRECVTEALVKDSHCKVSLNFEASIPMPHGAVNCNDKKMRSITGVDKNCIRVSIVDGLIFSYLNEKFPYTCVWYSFVHVARSRD